MRKMEYAAEHETIPEQRRCEACGQTIPANAKLASTGVTRAHAALLGVQTTGGPESEQIPLTLCLNCRIQLSKLTR